jgi:hypothetical protein
MGSATPQKSRDSLFVYISIASPSQVASKCLQFVVLVTITMGVVNGDHGGWPVRPPIGQKKRASSYKADEFANNLPHVVLENPSAFCLMGVSVVVFWSESKAS